VSEVLYCSIHYFTIILSYTAFWLDMSIVVGLGSLPVEILEGILSYLPTRVLLRIGRVSRRIYSSVEFITGKRFRGMGFLEGHNLVFQCSSPSDRVCSLSRWKRTPVNTVGTTVPRPVL